MNHSRFYLIDHTNPDSPTQTELTRSMPNDIMPTLEYDVPVELEVTRVKTVVGYGNIDTFIYAVRPVDQVEPEADQEVGLWIEEVGKSKGTKGDERTQELPVRDRP